MDQVFITSLIAIVSFLFKISSDVSGLKSEFRQYAKYNDIRLSELTAEFKELTTDFRNHVGSHG